MTFKRLWTQIRLLSFGGNGYKRAQYAKKKKLYAEIGENCKIPVSLPLYPQLVRIHNNVIMHRSVKLVTHDYINGFLNSCSESYKYKHLEVLTPIEIMDNVYIGMNVVIFGNVKIGSNVIVQAGSLVLNDIPPNSVVGGVPAKVVGKFDILKKTRILADKSLSFEFERSGAESIDDQAVHKAWILFNKRKNREQAKELKTKREKNNNDLSEL